MVRPSALTTRRYPHHEPARLVAHRFIGSLRFESYRSYVLNATGVKSSSAARTTASSAKMRPASLHPRHPGNSTKLTNMGRPVF